MAHHYIALSNGQINTHKTLQSSQGALPYARSFACKLRRWVSVPLDMLYGLLDVYGTVFIFMIEHRHIHISHACGMKQESVADLFSWIK